MCNLTEKCDCANKNRRITGKIGRNTGGQFRRELYPTLPDFRSALTCSRPELFSLAETFGALEKCDMCHDAVVIPEVLEEAICNHYDTQAHEARISDKVRHSSVLASDLIMTNLCTVCAETIFSMPI